MSKKEFDRRDFLRLAAISPTTFLPKIVEPVSSAEAKEKLAEAGIADYLPVFAMGQRMVDKYGLTPWSELYEVCQKVCAGELGKDSPEVSLLRDGWGEKYDQASDDAAAYVKSLRFKHADDVKSLFKDHGDSDKSLEYNRDYFTNAARHFPIHAMSLSKNVILLKDGGWVSGIDGPTRITYAENPNRAPSVFLHESQHQFNGGAWKRLKPYIKKEWFIHFAETNMLAVEKATDLWLSSDSEEMAVSFVRGVSPLYEFSLSGDAVTREKQLADLLILENRLIPEFGSLDGDYLQRMTRLVYYAVNKKQDIRNKIMEGGKISRQEMELFQDFELAFLTARMVQIIEHRLVDPVENSYGGLPENLVEITEDTFFNFKAVLQQVRLAALSRLPRNTDYKTIKKAFDMAVIIENPEELPISEEARKDMELLIKYGAVVVNEIRLGESEYKFSILRLPDNPTAPDQQYAYFLLNQPRGMIRGMLIGAPKGYDFSQISRKSIFRNHDDISWLWAWERDGQQEFFLISEKNIEPLLENRFKPPFAFRPNHKPLQESDFYISTLGFHKTLVFTGSLKSSHTNQGTHSRRLENATAIVRIDERDDTHTYSLSHFSDYPESIVLIPSIGDQDCLLAKNQHGVRLLTEGTISSFSPIKIGTINDSNDDEDLSSVEALWLGRYIVKMDVLKETVPYLIKLLNTDQSRGHFIGFGWDYSYPDGFRYYISKNRSEFYLPVFNIELNADIPERIILPDV